MLCRMCVYVLHQDRLNVPAVNERPPAVTKRYSIAWLFDVMKDVVPKVEKIELE